MKILHGGIFNVLLGFLRREISPRWREIILTQDFVLAMVNIYLTNQSSRWMMGVCGDKRPLLFSRLGGELPVHAKSLY